MSFERALTQLLAENALKASVLVMVASACQGSTPVDRGGAATGDDLGRQSRTTGAGSAAANDSFLDQVPPTRVPRPAHDSTGRDTTGS
jgi:hypothetical protein